MKKCCVLFAAILALCPLAHPFELVDQLASTLGISSEQASGGTAALLEVAESQLGDEKFSTVTSAVPDLGAILGEGSGAGASSTSDLLGAANSLLGGSGSTGQQVVSALGLADTFDKLGLDPAMVSRFIPIILDYASSKGGQAIGDLLGKGFSGVDTSVQAPTPADDSPAPTEPEASDAPVASKANGSGAG